MHDQNNVFYAIALSVVILISWQYFFATSFLGKPTANKTPQIGVTAPGAGNRPQAPAIENQATAIPTAQRPQQASRQEALARSQRVVIDTPRVRGSIALTGGRIDDLSLVQYRETTPTPRPSSCFHHQGARNHSTRSSAGSIPPAGICSCPPRKRSGIRRDPIASGLGAR
jgi:YidC/Oxa1 family membrane protein insertase